MRSRRVAPSLSVIVPVRNGVRTLERCLQRLHASLGLDSLEVVVVDDGSSDGTLSLARRFPCRILRISASRGPAFARNLGARCAKSRKLAFVDADVFVQPDTLARLSAALEEHPAAFGAYASSPAYDNFWTRLYHTLSHQSLRDISHPTPVFCSYCAAIRKDVFLRLGGFDAAFRKPTFEDWEFGCRLKDAGILTAYLKDLEVVHAVHYRGPLDLGRAYFYKSRDLASLLFSKGSLSLGNQGWTHWRHRCLLVCSWGVFLLWLPAAGIGGPLGWLAWAGCILGFSWGSRRLVRSFLAPGPLAGLCVTLAYLAIHAVATAGLLAGLAKAGYRFAESRWPLPGRGKPAWSA